MTHAHAWTVAETREMEFADQLQESLKNISVLLTNEKEKWILGRQSMESTPKTDTENILEKCWNCVEEKKSLQGSNKFILQLYKKETTRLTSDFSFV